MGLLIKENNGLISEVLLAMKKIRFGAGFWNGFGGKPENGETLEQSLKREGIEEIGLEIKNFQKAAIIDFFHPAKPEWNQSMHVYLVKEWNGEPTESEEMKPVWFKVDNIPFNQMWPNDPFWLPLVLSGKKVLAKFTFSENRELVDHTVDVVDATTLGSTNHVIRSK